MQETTPLYHLKPHSAQSCLNKWRKIPSCLPLNHLYLQLNFAHASTQRTSTISNMAQRLIERACNRFRQNISAQEANDIETTASLDDVKNALGQIERHLAARQSLRNFDRIMPFLDAAERFSEVVEVICNGTPYLPWIWVRSYSIYP